MIDRILIVDDEFYTRQLLEEIVARHNIETVEASSGQEALELLSQQEFQMAFVDLKMGDMTGIDVLREAKAKCPQLVFVIMTAYGTVEKAVEAMRLGAFDFIIKPFSPDQTDVLIEKARQWLQMHAEHDYLQSELSDNTGGNKTVVGRSTPMQSISELIRRVARTNATVLVTGESGTGKELIASEISRLSDPEGNRRYIRMNCAAVPETLLESELFGHEKGAFTGATERRIGRFELADGGTLLLDEIGEISIAMQAKLLRVLQESEFERVGGSKTIKVNVRVIATTNRDLAEEVQEGNFREDLYYRLNVFPIHLPPLRERGDDVLEISQRFIQNESKKLRRELYFSAEARACMKRYHWPGNIRELENVVERVAILSDGPSIPAEQLPPEIINPIVSREEMTPTTDTFDLREIEKHTIIRALEETNGNRSKAAELLGFSVRTLRNKLNDYKRDPDPVAILL